MIGNKARVDSFATADEPAGGEVLHDAGAACRRVTEGVLFYKKARKPDWQLSKLARASIYGAALFTTLSVFLVRNDITPAEVYVWAGGAAAVFAFIMQQTLSDLFSGLAVSAERPFKLGDWLRLSDGTLYGSFCCLSRNPDRSMTERDVSVLRAFAWGGVGLALLLALTGRALLAQASRDSKA